MSNYTVKSGDSLSSIAQAQLGSMARWKEIASLNGLVSTLIRTGQSLRLPDDDITPVVVSVSKVPTGDPAVVSVEDPALIQEITVTAKRIDYMVLAGILLGLVLIFKMGSSKPTRRRRRR